MEASQKLWMTFTYFCENFQKAIFRRLLQLQRRCRAVTHLEMLLGVDGICDLDLRKNCQIALTYFPVFRFKYAVDLT